jgi:Xaa-Pro aminopeptidase
LKTSGGIEDWLPGLAEQLKVKNLTFEARGLTMAAFKKLLQSIDTGKFGLELIPAEGMVEELRSFKDKREVEIISRAVSISDAAVEQVRRHLKEGMTEIEVAWMIEKFMRENGSQPLTYDVIVAAGPNAALPHAKPSDRPIKKGEPVLLDFGAKVEGYTSDLSRTITIGKPDDTFNKVYKIVLEAQRRAIEEIRSGITGRQADGIARKVIEEAGYGDNFGHGLGHGLGLEIHEKPTLGPSSEDVLDNGMVFTVEPGVYISGWGGVRIEDTVMLEYDRIRALSQAEK